MTFDLWPAWLCPRPPRQILGARLVVGIVTRGEAPAPKYEPRKRQWTRAQRLAERQRQRERRALLVARGLTSKGKPRVRF